MLDSNIIIKIPEIEVQVHIFRISDLPFSRFSDNKTQFFKKPFVINFRNLHIRIQNKKLPMKGIRSRYLEVHFARVIQS